MTVPEGYFESLADCGLKHVEFGTESLCDPVLKCYGKPFRVDDVFAAHHAANRAGLHVAHYFLFAGPGENDRITSYNVCYTKLLRGQVRSIDLNAQLSRPELGECRSISKD